MAAGKLNLVIEQGADFEQILTFQDASEVAIDITAWTFAGQIRKTWNNGTVLVSFTFTILNQTTNRGQVKVSLTNSQTSALALTKNPESYVYDIETTVGSIKARAVEGTVTVSAEVTR